MKHFLCLLALAWTALGQTTLYLRYGEPGSAIQIMAASNSTPIEITTKTPHGFAAGQTIWIQGVQTNLSANGARVVKTVTGPNQFTITDNAGQDVAGIASYTASAYSNAIVGATKAFPLSSLQPHPRVWLDGPNGALTTSLVRKAVGNNPPWDAIIRAHGLYSSGPLAYNTTAGIDDAASNQSAPLLGEALRWLATGDASALNIARYWIDNIERQMSTSASSGGHFGCDEAGSQCGAAAPSTDYFNYNLQYIATAYSIIRSQLTSDERQAFANKMFNDNQYAYPTTQAQCTNQAQPGPGTISTVSGSKQITYTDAALGSAVPGDYIWIHSNNFVALITAITTNTQTITLNKNAPGTLAGSAFLYVHQWQNGDCGALWKMKHHYMWPGPMGALNYFGGPNAYPTGNGVYPWFLSNHVITRTYSALMISLALADDDPRAADMLSMSYNFFFDRPYTIHKSYWSGPEQVTESYMLGRNAAFMTGALAAIKNSLGIDLYSDGWLKNPADVLHLWLHAAPSGAATLWPAEWERPFHG